MRIRLQYSNEDNRQIVEDQLQTEVRRFLPYYMLEEQQWGNDATDRHILLAYEYDSRCTFLSWELIERGRFSDRYFDNNTDLNSVPFQFQKHFNHGVMNSLGISKYPNEFFIYFFGVMEMGRVCNKRELISWLESQNFDFNITWG